jgi:uncharacterized protein (TIGR02757 family)
MQDLRKFLDQKVVEYNQPKFIERDPICIPHRFSKKQDIEIAGFFAAILAWGNRTTIIQNATRIMQAMDNAPHDFICHHTDNDLKAFLDIKHRTFNATDLYYFIHFLQLHYTQQDSFESAFCRNKTEGMKERLIAFNQYFFSIEHPQRTQKHISSPAKNSACKRLNMFLRWMVRQDKQGVDFGIWKKIKMHELICPLDIHVSNVAFRLQLIPQQKANWQMAQMLTEQLRELDAKDPAKYDFALFGLGAEEKVR